MAINIFLFRTDGVRIMNICYKNRNMLETVDIHDYSFDGFTFDYLKKMVCIECQKLPNKQKIKICFNNVILCNWQGCNFWHGGDNVMWISVEENSPQLSGLYDIQKVNGYKITALDQGIKYIEIELRLNSGDSLFVICQSIDVS